MTREFYGATAAAQKAINDLLDLPATGREQDWEYELADASKLGAMLRTLEHANLNFDARCALSLLLLATMQEEDATITQEHITEAARLLKLHRDVHEAMTFYWVELERADKPELVSAVLSV